MCTWINSFKKETLWNWCSWPFKDLLLKAFVLLKAFPGLTKCKSRKKLGSEWLSSAVQDGKNEQFLQGVKYPTATPDGWLGFIQCQGQEQPLDCCRVKPAGIYCILFFPFARIGIKCSRDGIFCLNPDVY